MSEIKRRELLKLASLGGGITALATVPSNWKKPVVTSLILPSHAQTSGCASSISTTSLPDDGGPDTDLGVMYDCDSCSLITGIWEDGDDVPDDVILAIDVDHEQGLTFDILNSGANWSAISGNVDVPPNGDSTNGGITPGTYTFLTSNNVCRVDVTFTVSVTGSSPYEMTLSNVSIQSA